jgi:hypothetical protein
MTVRLIFNSLEVTTSRYEPLEGLCTTGLPVKNHRISELNLNHIIVRAKKNDKQKADGRNSECLLLL